jgi:hypothetical protein
MDLAEAYRVLNVTAGAGEAQVRASHQQLVAAWLPFRQHPDPAARQRTEGELARFEMALQIIAAAGFPSPRQQPPQYAMQPPQMYPPPPPQQQYAYPPPPQGYAPPPPPFVIPHANSKPRGGAMLAGGIGLILLGAIITSATLEHAQQEGGTYIIAYGPILAGVILVFQGLVALARKK